MSRWRALPFSAFVLMTRQWARQLFGGTSTLAPQTHFEPKSLTEDLAFRRTSDTSLHLAPSVGVCRTRDAADSVRPGEVAREAMVRNAQIPNGANRRRTASANSPHAALICLQRPTTPRNYLRQYDANRVINWLKWRMDARTHLPKVELFLSQQNRAVGSLPLGAGF